ISTSRVSLSISTVQICVPKGKVQFSASKKAVVSSPGSIPLASKFEVLAVSATSSNATDFCGEPVTKNFPSSSVTSAALASRRPAAIGFIFSLSLCRAVKRAGPPTAVEGPGKGPPPLGGGAVVAIKNTAFFDGVTVLYAATWGKVAAERRPSGRVVGGT